MAITFVRTVSRILFWTYYRGTWQYDMMCGFILLFIFLTPKAVFDGSAFLQKQERPKIEDKDQELKKVRASNTSGRRLELADFKALSP